MTFIYSLTGAGILVVSYTVAAANTAIQTGDTQCKKSQMVYVFGTGTNVHINTYNTPEKILTFIATVVC